MGKFLLCLFSALAVNLLIPTQARLGFLRDQIDDFSPTIVALDGDTITFFDRNSLYSFEPAPLGNSDELYHDESGGTAAKKWIVRRVTNVSNHVKNDSRTTRCTWRFLRDGAMDDNSDEHDNATTDEENSQYFSLVLNALLSLTCVVTAALAAGLTMGLLSLDPLTLEIKRRASPSQGERQWSEDLLPLLVGHSKRHRLLVSLLLMNSIANEALPLFLDELLPGKYASILVSVTLVLFFGEIVPSAFFTGPDQVKVAAKLVPMVKVVMVLLSPLAVPIASLLDKVLHEGDGYGGDRNVHSGAVANTSEEIEEEDDVTGGNYYNRGELSALVRIQYEAQLAAKRKNKLANQSLMLGKAGTLSTHSKEFPEVASQPSNVSMNSSASNGKNSRHTHREIQSISRDLTQNASLRGNDKKRHQIIPFMHADEITMIEGALAMTTKVAADICTPLRRVFALPSDTVLDEDCMVKIWSRGFSRIPVYSPSSDKEESVVSSTVDDPRKSVFDVERSSIIGVLLARQLIVLNPEESRPITTVPLVPPPCVGPSVHLVDLINLFQAGGGRGKGGLHLALVCARPKLATEALQRGKPVPEEAGVVGIVTLEDVVEELLQEEIYDEYDRDLELSRWGINKWKRFVKRKKMGRRNSAESGAHFDSTLVRKVVIASEINTEVTPLLG